LISLSGPFAWKAAACAALPGMRTPPVLTETLLRELKLGSVKFC